MKISGQVGGHDVTPLFICGFIVELVQPVVAGLVAAAETRQFPCPANWLPGCCTCCCTCLQFSRKLLPGLAYTAGATRASQGLASQT